MTTHCDCGGCDNPDCERCTTKDCDECEGSGGLFIAAHQQGGEIIDEVNKDCPKCDGCGRIEK